MQEYATVTKKRADVSRLRVLCLGQCGKLELDALVDGEPMKTLKDGR